MQDDFRSTGSVKPVPKLKPTPSKTSTTEPEVPFQTPEQIGEHTPAAAGAFAPPPHAELTKPRGSGHHWFNLPWPPSRHEIWLISAVLTLAIAGTVSYLLLHKPQPIQSVTPQKVVKTVVAPKPTTVPSTLTGLNVLPEVNQRPVVSVMIENSKEARPQSGLSEAGVIFEAIAEGGITRFLAVYQDQQPGNVGPIRSARPYYVQWSEGFRAAYAHVGGSPDALANIKDWNVQDLNQYSNGGAYKRVSSRPSPHNVYASVTDLTALAVQKSFTSDYIGFARKKAAPSKQPTAATVTTNISSAQYNGQFAYDAATNTYLRSVGGAPQIDSNTGKQLSPSVVISIVVPLGQGGRTSQGGSYSNYNPIGSGTAYVFQDGTVTTGTWSKSSNTSQITFNDANGAVIKLNPGQTWITALAASTKVTY